MKDFWNPLDAALTFGTMKATNKKDKKVCRRRRVRRHRNKLHFSKVASIRDVQMQALADFSFC